MHLVKFCMFICFKPVLKLSKGSVKTILKFVSFRT